MRQICGDARHAVVCRVRADPSRRRLRRWWRRCCAQSRSHSISTPGHVTSNRPCTKNLTWLVRAGALKSYPTRTSKIQRPFVAFFGLLVLLPVVAYFDSQSMFVTVNCLQICKFTHVQEYAPGQHPKQKTGALDHIGRREKNHIRTLDLVFGLSLKEASIGKSSGLSVFREACKVQALAA